MNGKSKRKALTLKNFILIAEQLHWTAGSDLKLRQHAGRTRGSAAEVACLQASDLSPNLADRTSAGKGFGGCGSDTSTKHKRTALKPDLHDIAFPELAFQQIQA